LISQRNKKVRS